MIDWSCTVWDTERSTCRSGALPGISKMSAIGEPIKRGSFRLLQASLRRLMSGCSNSDDLPERGLAAGCTCVRTTKCCAHHYLSCTFLVKEHYICFLLMLLAHCCKSGIPDLSVSAARPFGAKCSLGDFSCFECKCSSYWYLQYCCPLDNQNLQHARIRIQYVVTVIVRSRRVMTRPAKDIGS